MKSATASKAALMLTLTVVIVFIFAATTPAQILLDPRTQPRFIQPLPNPPALTGSFQEITMSQSQQDLGLVNPVNGTPLLTTVWGYNGIYPGPTIVVQKGAPLQVRWVNNLPYTHIFAAAFDTTIRRAVLNGPGIPTCVHVHGGEQEPESDGHPDAWFTQGLAETGMGWMKDTSYYHNDQQASTIWYHDHALGYTRHNVMAGLAGFYIVTDPATEAPLNLPSGNYDRGIVIQDRMFTIDGQLYYPNVGLNPEHPVWTPEFFGNFIVVNGKSWPVLNVEPRKYRFRFLNGSDARFYELRLLDRVNKTPGPAFNQIGSDGGYLASPVMLNDPLNAKAPRLLLAPGERADVVIDFSAYPVGIEFILMNSAKAPYPRGTASDQFTGQIMKFRVVPLTEPDNSSLPQALNTIPTLIPGPVTRTLTLNEVMGMGGPLAMYLNGQAMDDPATETPTLGTTEVWEIINLTADTHPIHLHLVQFQMLNRQNFNVTQYLNAYNLANPVIPTPNPVTVLATPYLQGRPILPDPNERGWKDTFRMNPGQVTRVIVRFAPQDGSAAFGFDATAMPGYLWHCHILEHEENDMMRPLQLQAPALPKLVANGNAIPKLFTLEQNYPNPFNPETNIAFEMNRKSHAELKVYSILGAEVAILVDQDMEPGRHVVRWDGTDKSGSPAATGVYFYRLKAGDIEQTKKMIVLK